MTQRLPAREGLSFVYPYTQLCNKDVCKIVENGVQYYSDTHHLTREGAGLIMPEILKILQNQP